MAMRLSSRNPQCQKGTHSEHGQRENDGNHVGTLNLCDSESQKTMFPVMNAEKIFPRLK